MQEQSGEKSRPKTQEIKSSNELMHLLFYLHAILLFFPGIVFSIFVSILANIHDEIYRN